MSPISFICIWISSFPNTTEETKKFLILMKFNLIIFSFLLCIMLLVLYLTNFCLTWGHKSSLMFYTKNCILWHFTLRAMAHFKLFLYIIWNTDWSWIFVCVDIQLFQHHLLKKLHFLHWTPFVTLSKISCLYTCDLFLDFPVYSIYIYVHLCANNTLYVGFIYYI